MALHPVAGTWSANDSGASGFPLSNINDGNPSTYFVPNRVASQQYIGYVCYWFPILSSVNVLKIRFKRWTRYIRLMSYSPAGAAPPIVLADNPSGRILIRDIDTLTQTTDDAGNPWQVDFEHTIKVKAINVGAIEIRQLSTGNTSGAFYDSTNTSSAIGEAYFYLDDSDIDTTQKLAIGQVLPAEPYPDVIAGWKKTVISAQGLNTFVPEPTSNVLYVVAAGGGGGGTLVDGTLTGDAGTGEDSYMLVNGRLAWTVLGGQGATQIANGSFRGRAEPQPGNWLKQAIQAVTTRLNSTSHVTADAISGVGAKIVNIGSGGDAYIPPANPALTQPAFAAGTTSNFATNQLWNGVAGTGAFAWVSGTGLRVATPGLNSQNTGYFLSKWMNKGTRLTFKVLTSKMSGGSTLFRILLNETTTVWSYNSPGANVATTITYTIPADGNYDFAFRVSNTGSYTATDRLELTSIQVEDAVSVAGFGGGGAESRAVPMLYTGTEEIKFYVGKGGAGVRGSYSVPASANGQRGNGGAPGADGGDGLFIVYEANLNLQYQVGINVTEDANPSVPDAFPGAFTTLYGRGVNSVGNHYVGTAHKLRPATKSVIAVVISAGGAGHNETTDQLTPLFSIPSRLYSSKFSIDIEAGRSGTGNRNFSQPGQPGQISATGVGAVLKPGIVGTCGFNGNNGPLNPSGAYGLYGQGGRGLNGGCAGASGGIAISAFSASMADDGELYFDIGGAGPGNTSNETYGGGLFIYEFDYDIGATITQNAEMILRAEGHMRMLTSQSAEMVLKREDLAPNNITQSTELLLTKSKLMENYVSQTAEMILEESPMEPLWISQSTEQILRKDADDGQVNVGHMAAAFIYEADPGAQYTSQNAELVLTRSLNPWFYVTQSARMVLLYAPTPEFRFTQNAQLLHIKESPSRFWLRFGVLEYPLKKILYLSDIGRATNVNPDTYIQLEGNLPPGSTMIINDVEVGRSSPIKNNDRVQLKAGVMNYFTNAIQVYKYETINGEINRELVGTWAVTQPVLSPIATKTYYAKYSYGTARTIHGIASSGLIPMFVKNLSTYGKFIEMLSTTARAHAMQFSADFTSAKSFVANLVGEFTSAKQLLTDTDDWIRVIDNQQLVLVDEWKAVRYKVGPEVHTSFLGSQTSPQIVQFAEATHLYDHIEEFDVYDAMPSQQHVEYATEALGAAFTQSHPELVEVAYEFTQQNTGSMAISAYDRPGISGTNIWGTILTPEKLHHHSSTFSYDTLLSYSNSAHAASVYTDGTKVNQATVIFEAIPAIAYSSFTDSLYDKPIVTNVININVSYDKQVAVGTDHVAMEQEKLGSAGYDTVDIYAEFVPRDSFHVFEYGIFKGTSKQVLFANYAEKRVHGSNQLVPKGAVTYELAIRYSGLTAVTPVFSKAQTAKTSLFPTNGPKELINALSKASTYMGFDTQQAAIDFTENFADPVIKAKYNGFVYTLKVDESFMCEIYSNMPVKGLIQGG